MFRISGVLGGRVLSSECSEFLEFFGGVPSSECSEFLEFLGGSPPKKFSVSLLVGGGSQIFFPLSLPVPLPVGGGGGCSQNVLFSKKILDIFFQNFFPEHFPIIVFWGGTKIFFLNTTGYPPPGIFFFNIFVCFFFAFFAGFFCIFDNFFCIFLNFFGFFFCIFRHDQAGGAGGMTLAVTQVDCLVKWVPIGANIKLSYCKEQSFITYPMSMRLIRCKIHRSEPTEGSMNSPTLGGEFRPLCGLTKVNLQWIH